MKIIRFFTTIFIISIIILAACVNAQALEQKIFVTIKINGNCINTSVLPYFKDNRVFVPIRLVAESLGAEVDWVHEESKAVITNDEKTIELYLDSNEIWINSEKKEMDAQVELIDGYTMAPVRFIAEALDCSVQWDEMTYTALINKDNVEIPAAFITSRAYTDEDIIWLARIIYAEGAYKTIAGKVAVANVVLNRTRSDRFPDTIYDVIFDNDYCMQFPPAHKPGFRESIPSQECIIAAKMALEGINNIENCLFFNNSPFKNKSNDFYKKIDGEYFYF